MAQLLITHSSNKVVYYPIATIRQYNEPDFEKKLLRHSETIFEHYYVAPCKQPINSEGLVDSYEPDLILISKDFKKWVFIEVELCKRPSDHTLKQIQCFSSPRFDKDALAHYLTTKNDGLKDKKAELLHMFQNVASDLIVVLDDYSDKVFMQLRRDIAKLKICVLEVYKSADYPYEGFRFGGDYPYQLTNSSKIKLLNHQHYEIERIDFAKDLPEKIEVKYSMSPYNASILQDKKKYYLKIPDHNIPEEHYLIFGKDISGNFVIQRL